MKKLFLVVPLLLVIVVGATFIFWQSQQMRMYRGQIESLHRERDYARFQAELGDYGGTDTYKMTHDAAFDAFYYIQNYGPPNRSTIYRYEYVQDTAFQNGERMNRDYFHALYQEQLEKDNEWRLHGLVDGQIIFYKTSTDDSPGPCFSEWIGGYELFGVGVYSNNNIKYPYTISPEKKQQEEEKSRQCQKNL